MSTIVTRAGKGSPLTNTEVDANFTNLNTDKVEKSGDTLTGDLSFGDNVKAKFGASDDLQIYHSGSNSIINEVGAGSLVLSTNGTQVRIAHSTNAETMAEFNKNGSALLKYDGANKLETTSSGVDITGTLVADGATIDGDLNITFNNDLKISRLGSSSNGIYWDRSGTQDAAIKVQSNEHLTIDNNFSNPITFRTGAVSSEVERFSIRGDGDLYLGYEDTGTTAKLTWDASAEELQFKDNVKAEFGADDDASIYHSGSQAYIENNTGTLHLINNANDNDVLIMSDDGSGGIAAYFRADGNVGEAILYHYGSEKLATKSTGVDVTGTVTADDEIIVDGASGAQVTIRDTGRNGLQLSQNSTGGGFIDLVDASENLHIRTQSTNNIRIQSSGDISFYEDTGTTEKLTWDASAEELQFKDNVKAEFGDGGDLQIYHSGAASYITEVGTGSLVIGGDVVALKYEDANESYLRCYANDRVDIYYDNAIKLTTTSTGIDVTGTVTADGATINANNPQFHIVETTGSADENFSIRVSGGNLQFRQANDALNSFTLTQQIKASGDIVFYDDSGSSQDLYWDASTSRLGLGTTTPNGVIHAVSSGVSNFVFQGSDVGEGTLFQIRNGTNNSATGNGHRLEFVHGNNNSRNVFFRTSSTGTFGRSPDLYIGSQNDSGGAELDHVRIRAGGDVSFYNDDSTSQDFYWDASTSRLGIGTTSPFQELTVGAVGTSGSAGLGVLGLKSDATHKAIMIQENSGAEQYEIGVDANGSLNFYNSGSSSPMVTFEDNNDISFYNSDLSAATFRWDSSTSRLGIGTTSPSTELDVEGTIRATTGSEYTELKYYGVEFNRSSSYIRPDTDATKNLFIGWDGVSRAWNNIYLNGTSSTQFYAGASEVIRIDSSGRLGLGTSSPLSDIHIAKSAPIIRMQDTDNDSYAMIMYNTASGGLLLRSDHNQATGTTGSNIIFQTDASEAARIDSSGNLLVGKTSSGESNNGAEFRSSGFSLFTRNNQNVMVINRRNSDGDIVKFKKDGSAVGSILSKGTGTNLAIVLRTEANTDGCGIIGSGVGNGRILPADGNGDAIDNHIDLGTPNTRWQDLYLSGGVYLGGTGSANLLDDYEEGDWTPTLAFGGASTGITYSQNDGRYTKIGNQVTVHGVIILSSKGTATGTASIPSLPFAVGSYLDGTSVEAGGVVSYFNNFAFSTNGIVLNANDGTSNLLMRFSTAGSGAETGQLNQTHFNNNSTFRFSITYFT